MTTIKFGGIQAIIALHADEGPPWDQAQEAAEIADAKLVGTVTRATTGTITIDGVPVNVQQHGLVTYTFDTTPCAIS